MLVRFSAISFIVSYREKKTSGSVVRFTMSRLSVIIFNHCGAIISAAAFFLLFTYYFVCLIVTLIAFELCWIGAKYVIEGEVVHAMCRLSTVI